MQATRKFYHVICVSSLIGISSAGFAQKPVWDKGQTFTEAADFVTPDAAAWRAVKPGLHSSFVTTDKRYAKADVPKITMQNTVHVQGWKGERLSAQLLLWTADSIPGVKVQVTGFTGKGGKKLDATAYARFERYIITDTYGPGCGKRKNGDFPASLSPDMLDDLSSFNLEKNKVRPVWVTIDIPRQAEPGAYTAKVQVTSPKGKTQELGIALDVIGLTLPEPSKWVFHLDQWQHPAAVARVNNVPVWSEAHFAALKPQMQMLANAGQKIITATLNKDPWHVQTLDPYEDMIIWTKEKDGSWSYDYRVFDKWVSFMMDLGVKKMINCYSIVPWNNEIHYKDAATGKFVDVVAKPGTEVFATMWAPFLKDFAKHLKEKGWLEITNIALDERNKDEMGAAFALIEKVAPGLGVAYADNQKTYKRYTGSQDVSTAVQHPIDRKDLEERSAKGLNTTFYVYCGNNFPNQFTFSDPAESTYMGWYAAAAGYNGVLRWAFNSWVENPLVDSRFRTWPAGDTYIVYPQTRSSIRYERLVEGVQDHEKILIVKKMLEQKNDQAKLQQLNAAIAKLNNNARHDGWNDDLNAAKKVLNDISASLAK
ncbi:glycoside hydrolase domain-containing protein [Chitinophaga lutea]